jgi:hAT family C-terminal dimerisation region
MSSSVSSERAFSQGGITITKLRNCLKGDIVEALQCIKCAIRHDSLFREPGPSSASESEEGTEVNQIPEIVEACMQAGDLAGEGMEVDGVSYVGLFIEEEDDNITTDTSD